MDVCRYKHLRRARPLMLLLLLLRRQRHISRLTRCARMTSRTWSQPAWGSSGQRGRTDGRTRSILLQRRLGQRPYQTQFNQADFPDEQRSHLHRSIHSSSTNPLLNSDQQYERRRFAVPVGPHFNFTRTVSVEKERNVADDDERYED